MMRWERLFLVIFSVFFLFSSRVSALSYSYTPQDTFSFGAGYSSCNQEFANVSTACGGLDSGYYIVPTGWDNLPIDGNWSSCSIPSNVSSTENITVVYEKPLGATNESALQYLFRGHSITTTQIPSTCWNWNDSYLKIKMQYYGALLSRYRDLYYYCFNGSDWVVIGYEGGDTAFCEEKMIWKLNNSDSVNVQTQLNRFRSVTQSLFFGSNTDLAYSFHLLLQDILSLDTGIVSSSSQIISFLVSDALQFSEQESVQRGIFFSLEQLFSLSGNADVITSAVTVIHGGGGSYSAPNLTSRVVHSLSELPNATLNLTNIEEWLVQILSSNYTLLFLLFFDMITVFSYKKLRKGVTR